MAFESIKAEIQSLLASLADQPHDRRELELKLSEKLDELRAFGMPAPDDLIELEAAADR